MPKVQTISNPLNRSPRRSSIAKNILLTAVFALFAITLLGFYSFKHDESSVVPLQTNEVHDPKEASLRGQVSNNDSVVDTSIKPLGKTEEILPKSLTLSTVEGEILINLRPDLSLDSVKYIKALLDSPKACKNCRLYRAEQRGILQGILVKDDVAPNTVLGSCPEGVDTEELCHGPIMHRGLVGWAAGEGGPDFFIDNYKRVADWWGHEHTVWGEITDESSLNTVNGIFDLPKHKQGLTYLDTPIHIDMS